jgi:hypothetical protein
MKHYPPRFYYVHATEMKKDAASKNNPLSLKKDVGLLCWLVSIVGRLHSPRFLCSPPFGPTTSTNMDQVPMFVVPQTLAELEDLSSGDGCFRLEQPPKLDCGDGAALQRTLEGNDAPS